MIDPADARRLVAALGLTLTAEQEAVVFGAPNGPAVVIAGAGSGKTAVMAARIAVLVAAGIVPSHQVLGLTFTRKAAAELAERVDTYLRAARKAGLASAGSADPVISTYHSFAQRFVREQGIRLGIDPDLRVESDFGLLPLAYEVVAGSATLAQAPDHGLSLRGAVTAMRKLDAELAEHVVATDRLRSHEKARLNALASATPSDPVRAMIRASEARITLSSVVDEFRTAKLLAGVMDYADMMRLAQQIAAASGEAVEHLRETYTTVLLDEYQDTSVVQRMLLQRLFGDGHQVLAVGDPKQSIYAFRGAAAGSIEAFGDHFPTVAGAPSPHFALSANFRSGPAIVAVANDSAAARRAQRASSTQVALTSARPEIADAVEVHTFRSAADERRFVVQTVAAELAAGTSASDILVLARNNDAVRTIADALLAVGIPAVSSDQAGLFELPAVRDVLAELAVIVDPSANAELVRLLGGPRWRIGVRDLNLLGARARELAGAAWNTEDAGDLARRLQAAAGAGGDPVESPCLADALANPGDADFSDQARARFALLAAELESLAWHAGEPVPDLLARILRTTGADVELLLGADAEWASSAIDSLFSVAASFAASSPAAQAAGFLRVVRLARDADADPGFDAPLPAGSVRVMTVHKAKGLQAEVVLLPDVSAAAYDDVRLRDHWTTTPGALPEDLRGDRVAAGDRVDAANLVAPRNAREVSEVRDAAKEAETQEAERLVYVALTRARSRLVVSSHWWSPERKRPRAPSRHLLELSAHPRATTGNWQEPPPAGAANPLAEGVGKEPQEPEFGAVDAELLERRRQLAHWVDEEIAAWDSGSSDTLDEAQVEQDFADDPDGRAAIARWDADIAALLREQQQRSSAGVEVWLPDGLSASALQRLLADPQRFAADLRRPMPKRPSRQAGRGIRFHEWVAARWDQRVLVDVSEYAVDREVDRLDDDELAGLRRAFEAGEYADRAPAHIEYPFTVTIAGVPVSGRIDAIYTAAAQPGDDEDQQRWEVVDWKTSGRPGADPLQLAIYRLAWAKIAGVPVGQVAAAFYHVPTALRVPLTDPPSEAELAEVLAESISATQSTKQQASS